MYKMAIKYGRDRGSNQERNMNSEDTEHRSAAERHEHEHHEHFVGVSVSTTAVFFPAEGFYRVPEEQKVAGDLQNATEPLKMKGASWWIRTVTFPSANHDTTAVRT